MSNARRPLLILAGMVMTLGATTVPVAAAPTRIPQPILLSDTNGTWVEGQARWVTLSWTAQDDITDVVLRVDGSTDAVTVSYEDPANRYATLSVDPDLAANEVDTTSFLVEPAPTTPSTFELRLAVEWTYQGTRHTGSMQMTYEQQPDEGEAFIGVTEDARVPDRGDGSRNWVELQFLGMIDDLRDFTVSIEGPLPVYYPQTSYTSLHHDAVLEVGESDVARFWLDPSIIEPGIYELTVVIDYTVGEGQKQQRREPLTVQVG